MRIGPRELIGPWWPARSACILPVALLLVWFGVEQLRDPDPLSLLIVAGILALLASPVVNVLRRQIVVDADGISYRSLQAWRTRHIPLSEVVDVVTVAPGEVHDPRVAVLRPAGRLETIAITRSSDDIAQRLRMLLPPPTSPATDHDLSHPQRSVARPAALWVNDASTVTEMSIALGAIAAAIPVLMALVTLPSPRWPALVAVAAAGVVAVLAASIRYLRPARNTVYIDQDAIAVTGWGFERRVPVEGSRLALQEVSRASTVSPTLVALHGTHGIPLPIPVPDPAKRKGRRRLAGRPEVDLGAVMRERVEAFNEWHAAGSIDDPAQPLEVRGWKPLRAPRLMRGLALVLILAGAATWAASIGVAARGAADRAAILERSEVAWVEVLEVDCGDEAGRRCDVVVEASWHPDAATARHDVPSHVQPGDVIAIAHDPADPDLYWPPDQPKRLGVDATTRASALLAGPLVLLWPGCYLWLRATPPRM